MIPTIAINSIVSKWRDAIKNNAAIEAYCQAKYGKSLKIYVSIDKKEPPRDVDCPYVILFPGEKNEGLDQPEYSYAVTIGWAIYNKTKTTVDNVVEYVGASEVDELGQMIYGAIATLNPSYPASSLYYTIETYQHFPQMVGQMVVTLDVPITMGTTLSY